ncbi:hypothetical protein M427DRAFT_301466 [Gonapodya prolifera JEL478]|uniref:Uncharacterized protein n=1 Tax=Gonapodya prolifera (strain JEL478) TaxID=1344416 RepID=A0A139AH33_GONPJ|nr:hypothetical protein M427DRAFT_301466 [Gonapodya prolifera JEL478]|eukprot:KXS16132.1 hypothetical protein M427DRAFT_301466 [Gonapodya prolifera JEL478]
MSMTISRVAQGDGKRFVLWTSRILWEKPHAFKANYLGCPDRSMASSQDLAVKPVRTVCSYCKRVLVSRQEIGQLADMVLSNLADSGYPLLDEATKSIPIIGLRGKLGQQIGYQEVGHVWLTPTQYAQAFLSDDIIINHGLCELCYREIVFHFYPEHLRGTLVLDGAAMSPPSVYIVG